MLLLVGILIGFFMPASITSDSNGVNYGQILAYSFLLILIPLLPSLIMSVLKNG